MRTFEETFLILGRRNPRIWIAIGNELGLFRVSGSKLLTFVRYRGLVQESKSDIFRVREAKITRSYHRLIRNYPSFKTASRAFRYMMQNLPPMHPAAGLLSETESFLRALEEARGNYENLYLLWLHRFHAITSGKEHLRHCVRCGSEDITHFQKGAGLMCRKCAPPSATPLDKVDLMILENLDRLDFKSAISLKGNTERLIEILEDVPSWHSS